MKKFTHPYIEFEKTLIWKIVEKSINELSINQDIDLTTKKEYVVGYLTKSIVENLNAIIDQESLKR